MPLGSSGVQECRLVAKAGHSCVAIDRALCLVSKKAELTKELVGLLCVKVDGIPQVPAPVQVFASRRQKGRLTPVCVVPGGTFVASLLGRRISSRSLLLRQHLRSIQVCEAWFSRELPTLASLLSGFVCCFDEGVSHIGAQVVLCRKVDKIIP